jgi:hypothetical protein
MAPDMPYDDPEAGFEERVRPALPALEGVSGPLMVVGRRSGRENLSASLARSLPP